MSITIVNIEKNHKLKCSLMVRSLYLTLKVLGSNLSFHTFFDQLSLMGWNWLATWKRRGMAGPRGRGRPATVGLTTTLTVLNSPPWGADNVLSL
jgi:hypothetical protein